MSQDKQAIARQNSGIQMDQLDIGVMKSGDYMIHVYIQLGRNFKPEDSSETTGFLLQKQNKGEEKAAQAVFDPMIQIKCCGQTKYSTCKEKSLVNDEKSIYWGEHFFFEPRALTQDEIQSEKIVLKVLDKGFFKNKQVGEFEFDIAQIYFLNPEHAIQHQWIALVNPLAVKNSQIKGYLRLSVAIQGPGDSSLRLNDPASGQPEDKEILMPPQIRKKYKQIELTFLLGQKFPKMDQTGWVDPYIEINNGFLVSPDAVKYSRKEGVEQCEFNQLFKIPIAWPTSNDKLRIKIKDKDLGEDDTVGTILLSYKDIVKNYTSPGYLTWKNIYGAPLGMFKGPIKNMMNENPSAGTLWKGRVLMHIEVKDTRTPEKSVLPYTEPKDQIPFHVFNQAKSLKKYELIFEIGQGICLPKTKDYKIRVSIADFFVDTKIPKEKKKKYCRWSQRIEQQILFPYYSLKEMDQVYFYLMDGDEHICYWRGNIWDFTNRNPKFQWYPLMVDKYYGKVKSEMQAGMIQVKLAINNLEEEHPVQWRQYPAWKEDPPKRLTCCNIRCYIYQCRGLPAGDSDGTSDPYVQIYGLIDQDQDFNKFRTHTVEDNLNPIFYDTVDIIYGYQEKESPPPIVMDIFDSDKNELLGGLMDGDDDFLARAIIHLKDASVADFRKNPRDDKNLNTPPKPRWHKLKGGNQPTQPDCGEILCSFSLIPLDQQFNSPEQIVFINKNKIQQYTIDIHCLGLRNLQSFGVLPIRKSFIKFNVRSMLPPQQSQAVTNIKSEPKEPGPNPNINTCIQFQAELPKESLYCPSLACDVYDQICKGVSQPKIGSFTIPIGEIMFEQLKNRIEIMESAQNIQRTLNQAFQEAQDEKRMNFDQQTQQISYRKADHALKKMQKNYASAFGLQETELNQEAPSQINQNQREKQQLAMQMLQKQKEMKMQQQSRARQEAESRAPVRQIPSDSNMQSSLLQNDTIRNQTDTVVQDGAYESTVIIKESDYGDEESHSLIQKSQPSTTQQKMDTNRMEKLLSEDDHDALLLGLIQHSQPKSVVKDVAQKEQNHIRGLFNKIKGRDLQAVEMFNQQLAKLRKRRQQISVQPHSVDVSGSQDQGNRVKMLNLVEHSLLTFVTNNAQEIKQLNKQTILKEKKDDMIKMMQEGKDVHSNIIMPEYEKDTRLKIFREKNKPPSSIYYEVGYDGPITIEEPKVKNKHYRKYYIDELENNKQIFFRKPFSNIDIKRGQSRGLKKGFFDALFGLNMDESGFKSNEQVVGSFKGHIHVYNQKNDEDYEMNKSKIKQQINEQINQISMIKQDREFPFDIFNIGTSEDRDNMKQELIKMDVYSEDLDRFIMDQNYEKSITQQLHEPQNCKVCLYVLEGFDFATRDIGSFSDPYLKIKLGKKVINKRDEYQIDEPNPKFYQVFEMQAMFPGTAPLEIEAWDYDDLFGDDLIGKSVLDLDDRFFSPEWRAIENKPIEYRELYHPSTQLAQGTILCWVDIFKQHDQQKIWDVRPEPKKDYQLRLSVYGTQNVPMEDAENTSDVFVKAWINEKDRKETDTHWRCTNGEASFNYRMLFDFQSPSYNRSDKESYKLKIQLYDRDVFKSNDFICQFELDLYLLVLDCRATQRLIHLNKKYYESYFKREYNKEIEKQFANAAGGQHQPEILDLVFEDDDSFWLSIKHKSNSDPVRIRIDVRILSGVDANNQKVGDARSDPNHSPFLPAPINRFKFSMNPINMISQLFGPDIKKMIFKYFLMIICVVLLIFLGPLILSNIASQTILGFLSGIWGTVKSIF